MSQDLTAILLPQPPRGPNPDTVVNIVAQNSPPTAWVRLSPLEKLEIQQLEVMGMRAATGWMAALTLVVAGLALHGVFDFFHHGEIAFDRVEQVHGKAARGQDQIVRVGPAVDAGEEPGRLRGHPRI